MIFFLLSLAKQMAAAMRLLMLALLALAAGAAPAFDCGGAGCPATDFTPVCGADGDTYANECLAVCQGVPVASKGACDSAPGPHMPAAALARSDGAAGER